MNKSFETSTGENTVSPEALALINKFSQKELTADEIFTFSVILCDNEVDRDFERFSASALNGLAKLFIGKTAIRDHSMKSGDQSARTYKTEVITDETKKNSLGEQYVYLKAWCYMPKIKKNEDLISEIKSGILKEVSVGCAVKKSTCSICGKGSSDSKCTHIKGREYDGKLCFYELSEPTDAYEWSFVAVPAQKNAGVTKNYKSAEYKELSKQLELLKSENENLKALAKAGKMYRKSREKELVKALINSFPQCNSEIFKKISEGLDINDLDSMLASVKKTGLSLSSPQLIPQIQKSEKELNSQFKL